METKIYNQEGKEAGKINLSESVFNVSWNADLIHQVVVGMQANARVAIAHTKMRGEVRGGGKKPWKQKGTGRARHGSSRSPIWRGGGVAFGPRNDRNFAKKINRKMRTKALYSVLTRKFKEGEILFVDTLSFDAPKTALAKKVLMSLATIKGFEALNAKKYNTAYIALAEKDMNIQKSFSNFKNVRVSETRNLNPVEALRYKYIIMTSPKESMQELENRSKVSTEKEVISSDTK